MEALVRERTLCEMLLDAAWMSRLPSPVCDRVVSEAYETTHEAGETVSCRGSAVHSWIGVGEGLLKVTGSFRSGKEILFAAIPAGSWIGEGSVLKKEPRPYDIVAVRDTRLMHIPRATFQWLVNVSFEFNHYVLGYMNERMAQFMAMVETDRMTDPVARVSRSIVGHYNPVLHPRMSDLLPMSQQEIGELAGLSRQRTNLALQALAAAGLVELRYGALRVKDLAGLRECARCAENNE